MVHDATLFILFPNQSQSFIRANPLLDSYSSTHRQTHSHLIFLQTTTPLIAMPQSTLFDAKRNVSGIIERVRPNEEESKKLIGAERPQSTPVKSVDNGTGALKVR